MNISHTCRSKCLRIRKIWQTPTSSSYVEGLRVGDLMRFSIPVAAVVLTLLAAACSSTSPSATAPPTTAGATSPAPVNPDAGLLTGTQLKPLLAPASWFPHGFTLDPQGSVDTGDYYQPVSPPGPLKCDRLDGTSWVELGNGGAVSFAQNDYLDTSSGQYAQEIDVYQGTTAQDVMAQLRKVVASCRSFRDSQTSSTVTVTMRNGPQLGDHALTIRLQDPRWRGDVTDQAVRVGTAVITVYFSAASGTSQAQATRLATVLTANLKKKI